MPTTQILQGDALSVLKGLPTESVSCIMTSPPYWGLRDYGVEGQLGLEPNFNDYISKLCDIFDEAKRVLRKDGTCWVNLGDSYASQGNEQSRWAGDGKISKAEHGRARVQDYPAKSLCMIPYRFAIEMIEHGWILRNVIIWYKRSCMPSSVRDRFTVDYEPIFFFSKSQKYWFEQQFEPLKESSVIRAEHGWHGRKAENIGRNQPQATEKMGERWSPLQGRNMRTVWTINPEPFSEAHFACYPEKLCEIPIKAGCPLEICTKCGKAREKIYEKTIPPKDVYTKTIKPKTISAIGDHTIGMGQKLQRFYEEHPSKFLGYTNCNCNAPFIAGTVLDPFCGSGTTGLVARKLGRNFIGIELKPDYCRLAEERITGFERKDWKARREHEGLGESDGK